jgi:hypothetical protein
MKDTTVEYVTMSKEAYDNLMTELSQLRIEYALHYECNKITAKS